MAHADERFGSLPHGRWLSAIFGVAAALALACIYVVVRERYVSEVSSLLRVVAPEGRPLPDGVPKVHYATIKRNQAALLKSQVVLRAALRKPQIAELPIVTAEADPVAWLHRELLVDFPGDAEIMRVRMRGGNPDQLAKIVDAVVDAYLIQIVYAERDKRLKDREDLQTAIDKNREEIRRRYEVLEKMLKEEGGLGARSKKQTAIDDLDRLIYKRDQVDAQIRDLELKMLVLKARADKDSKVNIPDYYVEQELAKFPKIQELKAALGVAQKRLIAVERVSPTTSRAVIAARRHVENLQDQLEETRTRLTPQIRQALEGVGLAAGAELPALEIQLKELKTSEEKLTKELEEKYKTIVQMEKFDVDRSATKRVDQHEDTSRMARQLRQWDIEMNVQPRVRLLERAAR